jgi:hypothetical protein
LKSFFIAKTNSDGSNILHLAVISSESATMLRFPLTSLPASGMMGLIDSPDTHGRTPVHFAAQKRNAGTVELLAEYNADFNATDK